MCEQAHASTHSRALSVASTAAAARPPARQLVSHPAFPPTFWALALSIAANQMAGAHLAAGSTIGVVLQKMPGLGSKSWKQARKLPW
jgi:hypothetical protein